MNRKEKIKKLTSKVIKTLVFGVLIVVSYIIAILGISFDNSIWKNAFDIFFALFAILIVAKIWGNKKNKTITIVLVLSFICILANMLYYTYLSMYIEPLIHLNNRYNLKFNEMQVVSVKKSNNPVVADFEPRHAIVNYKGVNIFMYYTENAWIDDYEITKELNSSLNKIAKKFKISNNYYSTEEYEIVMFEDNSYLMTDAISILNSIAQKHRIYYNITFTNDKNIFNNPEEIYGKNNYGTRALAELNNYEILNKYYDKDTLISYNILNKDLIAGIGKIYYNTLPENIKTLLVKYYNSDYNSNADYTDNNKIIIECIYKLNEI